MKALITLMTMVFAFVAVAQTNTPSVRHGVSIGRRILPMRCFFVEKTSGRVPQNTILYPENPENRFVFPPLPYTNGVYIYKKNITRPVTNVVVVGSIAITNVTNWRQALDVFYEGTNQFEHKGLMIYGCGDDFIQLAETNIMTKRAEPIPVYVPPQLTEEQKKVQAERERLERLGVEERRTSLQEYKASTNLLSASELEAKGIKIMFREVLSVEITEGNGLVIVRRWIPCSDPIGKPIARIDTY